MASPGPDLPGPAEPNGRGVGSRRQAVRVTPFPFLSLYFCLFSKRTRLTTYSHPACYATQAPSPSTTPSPPTLPRARSSTDHWTWPLSRPGSAPARPGTTPCSRTPTGTRCSGSPRRGRQALRTCGGGSCLLGCDLHGGCPRVGCVLWLFSCIFVPHIPFRRINQKRGAMQASLWKRTMSNFHAVLSCVAPKSLDSTVE